MQDCSADFDDEEFQDAETVGDVSSACSLEQSIREAKSAVDLFFNNKFDEARSLLEPLAKSSMYHALGTSVFQFFEAIMTFEPRHVEEASESLKHCISVCGRHRKKSSLSASLGNMVRGVDYDAYTPVEIHAELCFAEAILFKAVLTFIEDETLVSFLKAGLKLRSCFSSYRECSQILQHREWTDECHKIHFEGGVRMGIGSSNLLISMLPARVIKILEFIGFSGTKEAGLAELSRGYELQESVRHVLSVMVLLAYHLVVVYVLGHDEGDLDLCDHILRSQLQRYPEGVWFLFLQGRLEFVRGHVTAAITWYTRAWQSQCLWPQFHHLCFWELMWANCVMQEWRAASQHAGSLVEDSRWSRTIYSYQQAALLCMLGDRVTSQESALVKQLLRDAPRWRQKVVGKALPMETFVVKRCERYFALDHSLVLPAIEMCFLWNMFKVVGKQRTLMDGFLRLVEQTMAALPRGDSGGLHGDNMALAVLLKGACLRQLGSPLQAEQCLQEVVSLQPHISEDTFLAPYAAVESALALLDQGEDVRAAAALELAKKNFSGYSLESRLHFKIHSAQTELQTKSAAAEKSE